MPELMVLHHADCNDGVAAAWAVHHSLKVQGKPRAVDFVPVRYDGPVPDVAGRHVMMVDFSYKRAVLLEMLEKAESIVILDHHKTAEEDLKDLVHEKLTVVFDMERSGAGIAWDFCNQTVSASDEWTSDQRPWFINYIEDNDLWRHNLPNCKAVLEYIRSYPASTHFEMFDRWMENGDELGLRAEAMAAGSAILRAKEVMVQQSLTFSHRQDLEIPVGEGQVAIVSALCANVPFFLSSDVAGALAERNKANSGEPLGITYYRREDGRWSLSFRSTGDYDVSKLALAYGGGGHRNAAGATVSRLPWEVA